jgi:choloylglycine hydrolase
MEGGPPVHYLIADADGHAVLAEFYRGELVLFPNDHPWLMATNFLRAATGGAPQGACWRFDLLKAQLSNTQGQLDRRQAMWLLEQVSQHNTQWSVVYAMSDGTLQVAMDRQYDQIHTFGLALAPR